MKIKEFFYIQGPTFISGFLAILVIICFFDFDFVPETVEKASNYLDGDSNYIEDNSDISSLEDITSEIVDVADVRYEGTIKNGMTHSYINQLTGVYQIDNGYIMEFGRNGSFSGFYDSENTQVHNYLYEIVIDSADEKPYVYIFNSDQTEAVIYGFQILRNTRVLTHKATGKEIILN